MTETVLTGYYRFGYGPHMDLSAYALSKGGTGTISCRVLGQIASAMQPACSAATLYMISKGHKKASALLARRIETATNGGVTGYDLRPDIFSQPDQKRRKAA